MSLNLDAIRADFPILRTSIHQHPLVYLDNAATTQKPQCVLDAIMHYYQHNNANVHRSVYTLSEQATLAYENARHTIQQFIHATRAEEIVFVRGTTEAINLVANSFLSPQLQAGDEILISLLEHHSNIVPWQLVAEKTGAKLKAIPINSQGELILDDLDSLLNDKTKLLAITHIANALGTVVPIKHLIDKAHARNIPVLIDGAQAAPHLLIDVQQLDCDFYAFSGHKLYGPTGIGVLYGKHALLERMPPYQGGGDMVLQVTLEKTQYQQTPHKFEAGTPAVAAAIGLGRAIEYINQLGIENICAHEARLLAYATERALSYKDLRIIGTAAHKAAILSFTLADIHPHDIATILDEQGIAIRSGHHCAMPTLAKFNLVATARVSFAVYNTFEEIDAFFNALSLVRKIFAKP